MYSLAYCYQHGIGCEEDEKMAFALYKQNWTQNKNSDSLHALTHCYEDGMGCDINYDMSFVLHELNWNLNKSICSLRRLIVYYEQGLGCTRYIEKSEELSRELSSVQ